MKVSSYTYLLLFACCSLLSLAAQTNGNENKVLTQKEVEVISTYYDATTQKLLGNDKEAAALYLLCINKDPKNAGAHFELAVILNRQKQPTQAVSYAKTAAELDPKNKWFLLEYADLLVQTGKVKQASKVYDQLLKLYPNEQDYLLQKADILIFLKQYKSAISIYDKLEKKLGVVPEISIQKQKLYLAQGKYDAAEKEMERLINAFPNEPKYYGMFAEFYMNINQKEKALKMFEKVLELDPENPIIHLALANYYQEINESAKAFEYIKLAFKNIEVGIDNKIKIMLSYYDLSANNQQRKTEAYELLEILLLVHFEDGKSWSIHGDFLLRDGKFLEAIASFEKVIELSLDKYQVWDQLLKLYAEQGIYDKLEINGAKAVELFPNMPLFYYFNGLGLYQNGKNEQALEVFQSGKTLAVGDVALKIAFIVGMADVYADMGKESDAKKNYESALELQGNNFQALISYVHFLASNKNLFDYKKCSELLDRAKRITTDDFELYHAEAMVEFKSGNYTRALELITKSIDFGGSRFAIIVEHYGDILFQSGKTDEAIENWEKAKKAKGKHSRLLDQKLLQKKYIQ